MPPKTAEVWQELRDLRSIVDKHLEDSINVHTAISELKTDTIWIKRGIVAGCALATTAVGGVLVQLFLMIVKR